MSLINGHIVSKETWDSHKMMLEPLATNDSEVCVHLSWIGQFIYVIFAGDVDPIF